MRPAPCHDVKIIDHLLAFLPGISITLRAGNREYFYDRLEESFPGLRQRYAARFGNQYWCPSPQGAELFRLFAERCEQLGLLYKMPDIIAAIKTGYGAGQISLWDGAGET